MTSPPIELRAAGVADLATCRAWLPRAFPISGRPAELIVASTADRIVAAGATAWIAGGFLADVHVEPAWRRHGIGRRLIAAMAAAARGETPALRSWSLLAEGDGAFDFARAVGFVTHRRLLMFETDAAHFEASMTALLQRLAGRMSDTLTLAPLSTAPVDAVVTLVASNLHRLPQNVLALISPDASAGYDRALSLVVMHGAYAVGAMLCRREADYLLVDVNVVTPAWRGGATNLLMLEGMARRARAAGVRSFRFSCEEHVRDTIGLARRSGARTLPAEHALVLPLLR